MRCLFALIFTIVLASVAEAQDRYEIAYGSDTRQSMDVYPVSLEGLRPAIVMLHGGAWDFGDKRNGAVWRNKSRFWGNRDLLFISVNTRLLPQADPLEQTHDLGRALAFIQRNHLDLGVDQKKIILMGHSAGAHVAGLLAVREDIRQRHGVLPWAGTVMLDTAAFDIPRLMQQDPRWLYRNAFGSDPAYWSAISPQQYLDNGEGPFLIVCSTRQTTPCPAATNFKTLGSRVGSDVTVIPIDMTHRAINLRLGLDYRYTVQVDSWINDQIQ